MFIKQMLIRGSDDHLHREFLNGPDFTVINSGEYYADPDTEDMTSRTSIAVNFTDKEMVILGS